MVSVAASGQVLITAPFSGFEYSETLHPRTSVSVQNTTRFVMESASGFLNFRTCRVRMSTIAGHAATLSQSEHLLGVAPQIGSSNHVTVQSADNAQSAKELSRFPFVKETNLDAALNMEQIFRVGNLIAIAHC